MSRSASSMGRVASARSSSGSVTADIRREMSTHARMPFAERSLVYAKPSRCSSSTRIPMPRSPRAITDSMAPSLISTDPDWASRKKTSPVAPVALRASRATSTVASFVSLSLMSTGSGAGGACPQGQGPLTAERFGGARSPPPPRLARRSLRSLRAAGPRGTRGSRTPRSPVPPAGVSRFSLELSAHDDRWDADRRLRIGDRRALTILPTGAGRISEVTPDHVYFAHQLRSLSYQCRAPQGLRQFPVPDPIALGDFEREVSRYDVHLSSAHLLDEDPVLD